MLNSSTVCRCPHNATTCRYKQLKKTLKECRLQAAAVADGDASGGEEAGSATPPAALPAAAPSTAAEAEAAAAHLRRAEARFFELLEGELFKANRWANLPPGLPAGRCLLPVQLAQSRVWRRLPAPLPGPGPCQRTQPASPSASSSPSPATLLCCRCFVSNAEAIVAAYQRMEMRRRLACCFPRLLAAGPARYADLAERAYWCRKYARANAVRSGESPAAKGTAVLGS